MFPPNNIPVYTCLQHYYGWKVTNWLKQLDIHRPYTHQVSNSNKFSFGQQHDPTQLAIPPPASFEPTIRKTLVSNKLSFNVIFPRAHFIRRKCWLLNQEIHRFCFLKRKPLDDPVFVTSKYPPTHHKLSPNWPNPEIPQLSFGGGIIKINGIEFMISQMESLPIIYTIELTVKLFIGVYQRCRFQQFVCLSLDPFKHTS